MRWFEGDIVQAVTQSRARKAVFVVFVEGKDETSQRIASAIEDADVSSKLEGPSFVAIHFESGTQTFNQFSQIYRDPAVPSLYFIGSNGSPIEIVTQVSDAKSLLEKIEYVESIHIGKPSAQASTPQPATGSLPPSNQILSTDSTVATETEPSTSSAPLEDRVDRVKELLEEKRMKKRIQEEEEARQKEMQRRKEGQNVQELRRWQQEQELKQLKEERAREKRIEQEAKQRVLEQIAQDRAARNARSAASAPAPASTQTVASSVSSSSNTNEARLQFRLPDGSTHSNRFNADDTLADVRNYISSNITLPYKNFALATAFPRREFSSQDSASTLRDLQLVPSSVMLIIPAGGSSSVQRGSPSFWDLANTILMFVTYPVTQVFSYIRNFIFGSPPPSSSANSSSGSTPSQNQSSQQDKRSQRRSGGAYRRAGNSNVHRLHQNHSSSDDENNTWNGNSTQQM